MDGLRRIVKQRARGRRYPAVATGSTHSAAQDVSVALVQGAIPKAAGNHHRRFVVRIPCAPLSVGGAERATQGW
jgi:hypothetical protein